METLYKEDQSNTEKDGYYGEDDNAVVRHRLIAERPAFNQLDVDSCYGNTNKKEQAGNQEHPNPPLRKFLTFFKVCLAH
jgi:hypothetical protein